MIRTVIFDIGNVLMKFKYVSYIKDLLKDDSVINKVNEAMWYTGYWDELDLGHDPEDVFARMYEAAPEYEKEIRTILENVGQCMDKADYAIPWIRRLKERGYRVLFLSNYSEFIMDAKREVLDFLPLMDGGIFSCYVGMIKPDPAIFAKICDEYHLVPEECVFIDDNEENILAARDFGFHAIRFKDYGQASEELERQLREESFSPQKK